MGTNTITSRIKHQDGEVLFVMRTTNVKTKEIKHIHAWMVQNGEALYFSPWEDITESDPTMEWYNTRGACIVMDIGGWSMAESDSISLKGIDADNNILMLCRHVAQREQGKCQPITLYRNHDADYIARMEDLCSSVTAKKSLGFGQVAGGSTSVAINIGTVNAGSIADLMGMAARAGPMAAPRGRRGGKSTSPTKEPPVYEEPNC
jgi:hypothetical protein